MKDLIIITDQPITYESCEKSIKNAFKHLILCGDNHVDYLYMKRSKTGFELYFSPSDVLDNPDFFMGDTVDKVPNKKAFLTNLSYTSKAVAEKIVSLLQPFYGNMWIQSDEEDNWFGTADEFIQNYCK